MVHFICAPFYISLLNEFALLCFFFLLQSSVSSDTHLGFFLLLWLRQRALGQTVGARVLRETPAGLDEMRSHLQRELTHGRIFFSPFSFLLTVSFAASIAALSVVVFHLHLPLFISSEIKAPALVVVVAAILSASRGKSFSLHSSSLHSLVRSFILGMLMGSHTAADLWRGALQCVITKHPAPWWIAVIPHVALFHRKLCTPPGPGTHPIPPIATEVQRMQQAYGNLSWCQ